MTAILFLRNRFRGSELPINLHFLKIIHLKINYTIAALFFMVTQLVLSQGEASNWYFGTNAGVSFNTGFPVALTNGALNTAEGCATISDSQGNLRFYTDGRSVFNRNHQAMPNGSQLQGNSSSTQSGLIVPHPGNPNLYYVFTLQSLAAPGGLRYSIVDINLDNGLGDVTSDKNVLLHDPTTEKITAVAHSNGIDVWVIAHRYNSNEFTSYLISTTGINNTPVISAVGNTVTVLSDVIGQMKASPDGTKLAVIYNESEILELLDFDPSTGMLSNPFQINSFGMNQGTNSSKIYGVEFSPRSRYLYVSESFDGIYQFDLINFNAIDVDNSKLFLGSSPSNSITGSNNSLQLATDGKIYVAQDGSAQLGVINAPDEAGLLASYSSNGANLNGRLSRLGLPPFIQSYFDLGFIAENVCLGDTTQFTANLSQAYSSLIWDFGDGTTSMLENPTHVYTTSGSFMVTLNVTEAMTGQVFTDSQTITIYETPVANPVADLVACDDNGDGIETFDLTTLNSALLNGQGPNGFLIEYFESMSDLTANTAIQNAQAYNNSSNNQQVIARISIAGSEDCFDITNFNLVVIESPQLFLEDEYFVCDNVPAIIDAGPSFDEYLWSTGETTSSISIDTPGNYDVKVTTIQGATRCDTTASFDVIATSIQITNVIVEDWTLDNNTITIEVTGIGDFEYSIDGITYQMSNTFTGLPIDEYTVFARDLDGCSTVSKDIIMLYYPRFFTPNGDNFNDFWQIINGRSEPNNRIYIYDRYGKLLKQISADGIGWDGTYNGAPLPSSDYWFVVERENGRIYKGHFALLR